MPNWIFITDLHLTHDRSYPMGKNTYAQFDRILKAAMAEPNIEGLILGGDICHTQTDIDVYRHVQHLVDGFGVPCYTIPGNHDDPMMIVQSGLSPFEIHSGDLYGSIKSPTNILFLDTSKAQMTEAQWEWLNDNLRNNGSEVQFIAMHHPPLICGSRHMEPKYMFKEIRRFQDMVRSFQHIDFHVFCGHFHLEKTINLDNLTVYITPSTFFQIDPESIEVKEYMPYIGYRIIQFDDDGNTVNTHVKYL